LLHVAAVVFAGACLAVSCGGSGDSQATAAGGDDPAVAPTAEPTSTSTPVVIVTSTPFPTATPLPTSTPAPLEQPTPTTVLLTTAFTNSSKVTTVGIDEVFFGTRPEDAAIAAETEWVPLPSGNGSCYRVTPSTGPEGVTLWVVDGFIERLDIEHPDIRTPSKLGLGNSAAELRSQLGNRLTVEASGDGGQVATFTPTDPGDRDFRIVFELEDDKVVRYRSGRIGIIDRAVEGC